MAPRISLGDYEGVVSLPEIHAPSGVSDLLLGEPIRVSGSNSGDSAVRNLSVTVEGEGAGSVQLAVDENGEPGIWTDAGGSILVVDGNVRPGEAFSFWARGVFSPDDAAGTKPFEFVFSGTDIG